MKLMKRIKSSILSRYIFYYFIIFLIPFTILSTFAYQLSLEKVEEQFESAIKNDLNQMEKLFKNKLDELNNISTHITINSALSPFMMAHPFYNRIGTQMLSSYISSQGSIKDIIIYYFSKENQFYGSEGAYQLESLIKRHYQHVDVSPEELHNMFYLTSSQLKLFPIVHDEGTRFKLQYVSPLFDLRGTQYGTAVFLFDQDKLSRTLPAFNKGNSSNMFVVNEVGQVLLDNNSESSKEFVGIDGKMLDNILKNVMYHADGTDYHIVQNYSEELGLKFVSIIDSQELTVSLIEARDFMLKLLGGLFLIGFLLILLISYRQYLPIKQMLLTLTNKKREHGSIKGQNELENIKSLVTNIVNQNEALEIENQSLQRVDENQLLIELIEGMSIEAGSQEIHPFIEELKSKGHSYYISIIKKAQLSTSNKSFIHQMFPIKKETYLAYMIQIPFQNRLGIVVVHTASDISVQHSLRDIEKELNVLEDNFHFYYGGVYEELSKIKHSYIEAMIACDYLIQDSVERLIPYKSRTSNSDCFLDYPIDIETKLVHSIKQGTNDVAYDSMKQIFHFLYSNKHHSEEIKIYSFYLINLMMKTAAKIGFPREELNLKILAEYQTLQDLEESLLNLVSNLNKSVQSKRDVVRDKFREDMFAYILEYYNSYELSLESLAERYNYSAPYLSKIIKEETGMTFTKYVQELRLNYIKKKLVETKLPIKDIINQAGYYDVSNFSRKFKNILGVTPGQYRELHQKQSK